MSRSRGRYQGNVPTKYYQASPSQPQLNHIWSNFSITGNCAGLPGPGRESGTAPGPGSDSRDPLGEQLDWRLAGELTWAILNPKHWHFLGLVFSSLVHDRRVTLCLDVSGAASGNKTYFLPHSALKIGIEGLLQEKISDLANTFYI